MAVMSNMSGTATSSSTPPLSHRRTFSGSSIAPEGSSRHVVGHTVKSRAFEYSMAVVIFLNVVGLIIETDQTADGGDPAAWIIAGGWTVLVIFILEMLLRLYALGHSFWKDAWNVIDFIVVVLDTILSFLGLIIGAFFPVSILRIIRLTKLMRMSKLFRLFPELRVMARSLAGAARAIGWGLVMVFFILLVWSLIGVVFIHPLARDLDFDECPRCNRAYASVFDSMLTLWQSLVIGDGWGPGPILLIETHPTTLFFFIPMFGLVGMAVLNLILGVVVDVSMTAKGHIEEEDEKERKIKLMHSKVDLMDLMKEMDKNSDGCVSEEEAFNEFHQPGEFRDGLLAAGITEDMFAMIWTIIDHDKKGRLPFREFIDRLFAIRTSETSFMLTYIKFYITLIRDDLLKSIQVVEAKVDTETKELKDIHKLEASMSKGMEQIESDMSKVEASLFGATMTEAHDVLKEQQALQVQQVKLEAEAGPNSKPGEAWISSPGVLDQCILNLQTELEKVRDSQMETSQYNGLKVENALQDIQGELKRSRESQMELKEICTKFRMESALQDVMDMRSEVKFSIDGLEAKQNGLLIALKDLTESLHRESCLSREPSCGTHSVFL